MDSTTGTTPLGAGDGGSVARLAPVYVNTSILGSAVIAKISVTMHTAQVLTAAGEIYAFGDNKYYQVILISKLTKRLVMEQP
jgi:alpha-tubulin suppressor-like RCC1 family protein